MIIPKIKKITMKRLEQLKRDSNGEAYQKWRNHVLKRDEHKCQYMMCSHTEKLQVHHIRRFKDAPYLKTNTLNGITLCETHHKMIYRKETAYEITFFKIAQANEERFKKSENPS